MEDYEDDGKQFLHDMEIMKVNVDYTDTVFRTIYRKHGTTTSSSSSSTRGNLGHIGYSSTRDSSGNTDSNNRRSMEKSPSDQLSDDPVIQKNIKNTLLRLS